MTTSRQREALKRVGEIPSRRRCVLSALAYPPVVALGVIAVEALTGGATVDSALHRLGLSLVASAVLVPVALWARTLQVTFGAMRYRALGGRVPPREDSDQGAG